MAELAEGLAGEETQEDCCAGDVAEEGADLVQKVGAATLGHDISFLAEVALGEDSGEDFFHTGVLCRIIEREV